LVQAEREGQAYYANAKLAPEDNDPKIFHPSLKIFWTTAGDIVTPAWLNAYRIIRPEEGATTFTADFTLDRGKDLAGRVVDPAGKPLSGVCALGLLPAAGHPSGKAETLSDPQFSVRGLTAGLYRRLLLWHPQRNLAATVLVSAETPEPMTVELKPLATVAGRVLDADRQPRAGAFISYDLTEYPCPFDIRIVPWLKSDAVLTGHDGQFRIAGLPAGLPISIMTRDRQRKDSFYHRIRNVVLTPGETKELGDYVLR
jgi:hypothetical protein